MEPVIFKRPVDGALSLFDKGFKVFPVLPDAKEPAVKGWQEWARTATIKKIEEFSRANPTFNWGVACGESGLLVVDIDTKKGRKGVESLNTLLAENSETIPDTYQVKTPSGGLHYYFIEESRSIHNSSSLLGDGIDIRGVGGYVLAPGSRIGGNAYEVFQNPIGTCPEWLKKAALKRRPVEVIEEGVPVPEGRRNEVLASFAGTMRRRGASYDVILAALLTLNEEQVSPPLPEHEVEIIARSIAKYKPEQAEIASDFLDVSPISAFDNGDLDIDKIPPRKWVMDNRFMEGFLSVIVSPGGVGKSTLTMLDAVAVATGRPITGFDVIRPGGVWIYNFEDPLDELKRRMAAICTHYSVPPIDLKKKVFTTSGTDHPFVIAKADPQQGVVINQTAMDNAIQFIKDNNIVLLIADPFVRIHECEENQNMQIDKVAWCLSRIAQKASCAVGIVHHTSKAGANAEPGDMNIARGATALVNAARIAHTISAMSKDEAKKFCIDEGRRKWYFRFDNAKANMQPPAERADWFERKSIILPNSDSVGVVERTNLKEIKKEKETEAESAEKRDISDCLYEMMKPGDQWTVDHTAVMMAKDPKFSHLFEGRSTKYMNEKLLQILTKYAPMQIRNRQFWIDYNPKNRPKYKLVCSEFDMNAALVDALQ